MTRVLPRDPHGTTKVVVPQDDIIFMFSALNLQQIDIVCKASRLFIATLYYVTCCRDLRVATPLAGDVGDALPNVVY